MYGFACLCGCLCRISFDPLYRTGVSIWRYNTTKGVSDIPRAPKAIFWAPSHALLNSLAYTAKVYHSNYQRTTNVTSSEYENACTRA